MRVKIDLPESLKPVFWGMIFIEATFGAYLGIWPIWIERLGAPITVVGLVLGSSGFLRLIVLAPSALIAERLGYRRAILLCRSASVLGLLSASIATHWTHLAFMLICGAIGELVFPLLQSIVAAQAGEHRMRSFALIFTVGPSLALCVSPLISGVLVQLWGMRAAFVFGASCTATALFFLRRLQEPPAPPRHANLAAATYRAALSDAGVRMVAFLLAVTVFSLSLGTSFVPTFLEDLRGIAPSAITTMGAAAAVGSATFGIAITRLRRLQRTPFIVISAAIAITAVSFMIIRSTGAIPLLVLAFFCRGGLFSAWATLSSAVGELAPAAHRARAFALCEMVAGVAYALGPIVAAPLYSHRPTLPFETATVLACFLVPTLIFAQTRAHRLRDLAVNASLAPTRE